MQGDSSGRPDLAVGRGQTRVGGSGNERPAIRIDWVSAVALQAFEIGEFGVERSKYPLSLIVES
jgi:hypothetical protein